MASTGTLADGTSRLSLDGTDLRHFNAVSSFAEHAVVPESVAVPIRKDVPLDLAALIGCAVLTGWGGVTRTRPASSEGAGVAVMGCGGVGLSVIQAARIVGAGPIVAVDMRPDKLELAERLGATATVQARPTRRHRPARTPCDGRRRRLRVRGHRAEETIREAWDSAAGPGGTAVVLGIPPKGTTVTIDAWGSSTRRPSRAPSSAPRASSRTSRGSSTSTRPESSAGGARRATGLRSPSFPRRSTACAPARRCVSSSCSTRRLTPHAGRRRLRLDPPELVDRDVAAHEVARARPPRGAAPAPRRSRPRLRGQRVWKTQPDGGSAALGISPSSLMRGRSSPSSVGTAERSASVYGWCGGLKTASAGAELHQPAEIEHGDPVGRGSGRRRGRGR